MQITYVGVVHDDVQVPAFGDAIIARGETVNVPDVELALSFLDQPDNWAPADDEASYFVALHADGVERNAKFADELAAWRDALAEKARADAEAANAAAFVRVATATSPELAALAAADAAVADVPAAAPVVVDDAPEPDGPTVD